MHNLHIAAFWERHLVDEGFGVYLLGWLQMGFPFLSFNLKPVVHLQFWNLVQDLVVLYDWLQCAWIHLQKCQTPNNSVVWHISLIISVPIDRSTRILQSWLASQGRGKYWRLETVAGVITGFSTSLISISLVRILHQVKSSLPRILKRQLLLAVKSVRFRRAFFLVTYVIFMGWLAIEYGKRLGISNIYRVYYF